MNGAHNLADVAVIMPAWQAANTIQRALRSIATQTLLPLEVVVVDDGSQDETSSRARAMADVLAPVKLKVIRQDNAGAGAARNRAIAESSASLLAFLDADDEWLPEKLERSVSAMEDPEIVLVAHNIVVHDATVATEIDCARHLRNNGDVFVSLFKRGFISTATVVCRRDAIEACKGFDANLLSGQDYDLWLTIARDDSRRIVVLPHNMTRYHVTPGSITSKVGLRHRCALIIARRHAGALRRHAKAPLAILLLRIMIVSAEATNGYLKNRDWVHVLWPLLTLPFEAGRAMLQFAKVGDLQNAGNLEQ